jgi:hypothetical protein
MLGGVVVSPSVKKATKGEAIMKKKILIMLATEMLLFGIAGVAGATIIQATITADNHYSLYAGNQSGVSFIGRNEINSNGSPGANNWSNAETFDFDMASGDYMYIAGWSDGSTAQGLLGQFTVGNSTIILTNTPYWDVYLTFNNLDDGSPAPSTVTMLNLINIASWSQVQHYVNHGSGPWGYIDGINQNADWIWGSDLLSGSNYGEFQIFRTKVELAPVPVPATILLFITGITCLAGTRLRMKKK